MDQYNPKERETHWQNYWKTHNIYSFDSKSKKKLFSIDTPPPTMSGRMHIGHAFSYSQQDFIARYKRMSNYNVFFPFGTDDNGLPTERMIEKMKNVKPSEMPREDFIKLCTKTLNELRQEFVGDWQNLGISCDFNVMYSTINEHCRKVSQWSFIDLYKKKRAYQKEAPTIWCPECKTAIAQAELQDKEKQADFVSVEVKTSLGKPLVFATTRPELMMACIAISVNPDDKRYNQFVGKTATIPASNAVVPIIADTLTKMEFGTGVVYWCPFGDASDVEFVAKHPELKIKHIKNKDGTLNELAGKYAGMHIYKARKQVIEDWKAAGAVKLIEKKQQIVNVHERCSTPVEYLVSRQWFIKYLDIKPDLIKIGKKLKFYPDFMRQRYENWVNGLKWDWCISRQRYFGIPFPVWYCKKCKNVLLADEKQLPVDPLVNKPSRCSCGSTDVEPEKDVFDTWATSSVTPLITQKLFDGDIAKKLYPMNMRPQGHDIISTWLFYTVVKSYLHFKKLPWDTAAISGWVLDPYGEKMSKSKGNVVAPQEIMAKYSADALRWAASAAKLGEDASFQDKELVTGQKFVTKLWNASKFCDIHLKSYDGTKPKQLEIIDQWLLSKLNSLITTSIENYDNYEYSKTRHEVELFFWHDFCDNYLEIAKYRLYGSDTRKKQSAQYALYHTLWNVLKLMAPVTPHITEEVYQHYFAQRENMKSIHLSVWPVADKKWSDAEAEKMGDAAVSIIGVVRKYKSQKGKPLNSELTQVTIKGFDKITAIEDDIKAVLHAKKLTMSGNADMSCEGTEMKVGIIE
ncbi:MAG TPA: valine--tRNA ligase [Candidatus Nanoarchaeia archaeon]|nr:valine--tRNA ligase [Candidatus Nanoarchaeia archaeon]